MKASAKAPANIAFIKYWGKKDEKLRLPLNSSISMNLDKIFSLTTVEFLPKFTEDEIQMAGKKIDGKEEKRITEFLDRVRGLAGINLKAKVVSENNFPKSAGIASSASGFAALSLAATKAAGLDLTEKDLSILARLGSGSACRSIPDGFVEWRKGYSNETSYAHSLYPSNYWDVVDVIAIVAKTEKKVPSTEGHSRAESSPFLRARVLTMGKKIRETKKALEDKDFTKLGIIVEEESISMHAVTMTSQPPIFYWLPKTIEIMLAVQRWRGEELESYFTLDAGPTVHVLCLSKNKDKVARKLKKLGGIKEIIINKPAQGARLVNKHLF